MKTDLALNEKVMASGKLGIVNPNGAVLHYFDVAPGNSEHFHQSLSIDFAICVAGQMQLKLDCGETRIMEPGDTVIQRATMHSWQNPSATEWCRLVAVMLPAKEFHVSGKKKKIGNDWGFFED